MVQAASDELLKEQEPPGAHIGLRMLWDHANYESDLSWEQTNHLESCEDCLAVLALSRIEKSFSDLERIVGEAGFFNDADQG